MHYQQHRFTCNTDRVPALLTVDHPVFAEASRLDRQIRAMQCQSRCLRSFLV